MKIPLSPVLTRTRSPYPVAVTQARIDIPSQQQASGVQE